MNAVISTCVSNLRICVHRLVIPPPSHVCSSKVGVVVKAHQRRWINRRRSSLLHCTIVSHTAQ